MARRTPREKGRLSTENPVTMVQTGTVPPLPWPHSDQRNLPRDALIVLVSAGAVLCFAILQHHAVLRGDTNPTRLVAPLICGSISVDSSSDGTISLPSPA